MTTWTKDQTTVLISLYKKFPNLYDAKHKNYSSNTSRQESLNKIRDKICLKRENTSIIDIKAKLRTIKSQYWREKRLINNSIKRGDEVHQPKLWFYSDIGFIDQENSKDFDYVDCNIDDEEYFLKLENTTDDHLNDNQNTETLNQEQSLNLEYLTDYETMELEHLNDESSNDETANDEDLTCEISNNEFQNKGTTNLASIRVSKLHKPEFNLRKSSKSSPEKIRSSGNSQQSHLYYFLKNIETELLALPDRLQQEAKWKIQDIVRETQREHLKTDKNIAISEDLKFQIDKSVKSISKYEYKTLQHLSTERIMCTFNNLKHDFDKLFYSYMANGSNIIPRIEGLNHLPIDNILSKDKTSLMVKYLKAHYEASHLDADILISNLVMPEWILALYMKEYKVSRTTAIQQFNMQVEIKSCNKSGMETECSTVSNETPQVGKPKILKVLQPFRKQNSSSRYPRKKNTIILGEMSNLETEIETSQNG